MYCFKKLKLSSDFRRIYGRGEAMVTPAFVAYAVKNRSQNIRLGITATKKIGGAVSRNRAKRVLTAAFAETVGNLNVGYDFVLVARTRLLSLKSTQVAASMQKAFREAGLLKENA